uniref:Ig-like domain-containing protein n=1 Tax=Periophthalmus magnuspinnatus TaxID=409849 RepID=A0A3B4BGV6_9GOBI
YSVGKFPSAALVVLTRALAVAPPPLLPLRSQSFDEDVAISPFYVSIQDSSNPQPGEDQTTTPVELVAGNSLNLDCNGFGSPDPEVNWIIPNGNIRYEVHKNGSLIIRNIQPVDGGEYLCSVQNQYGSDEMLTNLVVLSQHPKILQSRHRDVSVNLGSSIDLECQVEGHPKPKVMWVLPNHAQMAVTPFGSL